MMSVFAELERAMIRANRLAPMALGNRLAVGVQLLFVSWPNHACWYDALARRVRLFGRTGAVVPATTCKLLNSGQTTERLVRSGRGRRGPAIVAGL
jgi:hypothetical protein